MLFVYGMLNVSLSFCFYAMSHLRLGKLIQAIPKQSLEDYSYAQYISRNMFKGSLMMKIVDKQELALTVKI
jgi:hypothetical protein